MSYPRDLVKKAIPAKWLQTIRKVSGHLPLKQQHTQQDTQASSRSTTSGASTANNSTSSHPAHYTATSQPPSNTAPFPFSSLPTELRHQILAHVLTTPINPTTPPIFHNTKNTGQWLDFDEGNQEAMMAYILADGACSYDDPVLSINRQQPFVCPYLPLLLTSRAMKEDVEVVGRRVLARMGPVIDAQVLSCESVCASWLRMPMVGMKQIGSTGKGEEETVENHAEVVIERLTIVIRFCYSSTMTYKIDQTELIIRKLIRRVTGEGPSPYMRTLNGGTARVKQLVVELQTTPNAARYKSVNRRVPLARTLHQAWLEDERRQERELGNVEAIDIRVDGVDLYKIRYDAHALT